MSRSQKFSDPGQLFIHDVLDNPENTREALAQRLWHCEQEINKLRRYSEDLRKRLSQVAEIFECSFREGN